MPFSSWCRITRCLGKTLVRVAGEWHARISASRGFGWEWEKIKVTSMIKQMGFISFTQCLPPIFPGRKTFLERWNLGRHQPDGQGTVREKDGLELYLFDVYQRDGLPPVPRYLLFAAPQGRPTMAQSRFASKDLDSVHLTASSSTSPTRSSKPERVLAYASTTTPTLFYAAQAALYLFAASMSPSTSADG